MWGAWLGFVWLLPCAWTDARTERLPHRLTLTGLGAAVLVRGGLLVAEPAAWPVVVQAVLVGAAALWLHHHRRPDGRHALGGGDVPLLTGLALLCPVLLAGALVFALLSMLAGALLRWRLRPMTLAPAICAGWALSWGIIAALRQAGGLTGPLPLC